MEEKIASSVDWETNIYAKGKQLNRWPFDQVVSAVMRATAGRNRREVSVLEIGCGAGNNIWFLAAEGFVTCGLDMSPGAINYARQRLEELGLHAELKVGDIGDLPWDDCTFDFIIDRGALTQNTHERVAEILAEAQRVLKPNGVLMSFTLFGMNHPERQFGEEVSYHAYDNFRDGCFRAVGLTSFFTKDDLCVLFKSFSKITTKRTTVHDDNDQISDEVFTVIAVK